MSEGRGGGLRDDGSPCVETLDFEAATAHAEAWRRLMRRALEAQAFADPDFVLPLLRHAERGKGPSFRFIWSDRKKCWLIGVAVIERRGDHAEVWKSPLAAGPAIALDDADAASALDALADDLAREGARTLLIPEIDAEHATARLISARARVLGLPVSAIDRRMRAAMIPAAPTAEGASPKHRREWERQERRLAGRGHLAFTTATEPDSVRDAIEDFLALEGAGWKGAAGSALVSEAGQAAFARAATRLAAVRGMCRVDALRLDGRAVAMSVAFRSGKRLSCWKIAHDEAFAAHSPGALLVRRMTAALRDGSGVDFVDGCAATDQATLNRLWPGRQPIADALIALPGSSAVEFQARARAILRRRGLRERIKRVAKAVGVRR